jgi:acetylornithine deacetylase/succinyl-diaminopimelate desuccinylase-like protein
MLAGEDPEEILAWVRGVVSDTDVTVEFMRPPKIANLSAPDTEMYKVLADVLRARVPGAVVAPDILTGFTDNWVFRRCGLAGYGWSPFVLDAAEWTRVHGNDERVSLDNVRAGVRAYTEALLAIAA